jgi:transketolase N-terminal domain/subunit
MAHYAFLDENNIVTEVIVGKDEGEEGIDWEAHYGAFRGQTL